MARIIVFGLADFASLAHFYLRHDSPHDVAAFTVTREYLPKRREFEGKPIVPFEEVQDLYSPDDYLFFAPMAPKKMNSIRESVFLSAREKGYRFYSYVSSQATVFPETPIGDNCFILENNTLQPFVSIGDNVVLWSGNHIGHHSSVGDHVMFTSHVVLSGHCRVEPYCFLGVNATVRDGITLAEGTFVAMAAAVTRGTEAWGVYKGNPATKGAVSSKDLDF